MTDLTLLPTPADDPIYKRQSAERLRARMTNPARCYEHNGVRYWLGTHRPIPPHIYAEAHVECPAAQKAACEAEEATSEDSPYGLPRAAVVTYQLAYADDEVRLCDACVEADDHGQGTLGPVAIGRQDACCEGANHLAHAPRVIRPERSFEQYSRGAELVRAIQALWRTNRALPPGANAQIDANIQALRDEFDLTLSEWHYWAEQTREALEAPCKSVPCCNVCDHQGTDATPACPQ